jgi:cyclic pyranopterin monophosphate synthase
VAKAKKAKKTKKKATRRAKPKARSKPRPKARSTTRTKNPARSHTKKHLSAKAGPAAPPAPPRLSHIDQRGQARMVDVGGKGATERMAVAEGRVIMAKATLDRVVEGNALKGDVLGAARLAGIMAAKRTHGLIPLCHPLPISKVEIEIDPEHSLPGFLVRATVKVTAQTGVEMEALVATSIACLTIYDMCKAIEKGMHIDGVRLLEKTGGKSGPWRAENAAPKAHAAPEPPPAMTAQPETTPVPPEPPSPPTES